MTKLSQRKTKLTFATDAEVRYRGKMRPAIVETHASGLFGLREMKVWLGCGAQGNPAPALEGP